MDALLIEDDSAVSDVVRRALEGHGYIVTHAKDGESSLEVGAKREFDICLLDLNLPGMDGLETLNRLRRTRKDFAPVIVITGDASMEAAVESMRHGAADFITKPFSVTELLKAVDMTTVRTAMQRENRWLRAALAAGRDEEMVGESRAMRDLVKRARRAAGSQANVLITGATGTGKSLLARKIHEWSERAANPFVALSCAALPAELVESELFGHEKGAFTGAVSRREGRFELAGAGTLFLDEIGEMPLALQPKLLRVLQSGEFEPIGSKRTMVSEARVIAATNRDLEGSVAAGEFRDDLYYRLSVVVLQLPALRQREGDVELLAERFVRHFSRIHGKRIRGIDANTLAWLAEQGWPGNVRQLRNVIERAVVFAEGEVLDRRLMQIAPNSGATSGISPEASPEAERQIASAALEMTLADVERLVIERVLADCNGCREAAADRLGVSLSTLYRRLREYRESDEPARLGHAA